MSRPRPVVMAAAAAAAIGVPALMAGVPAVAAWLTGSNTANQSVASSSLIAPTPTATALSSSSVQVSWPAVPGQPAAARYSVKRTSPTTKDVCLTDGTSCEDTGLSPNTAYTYSVAAVFPGSNWSSEVLTRSATTRTGPALTATPATLTTTGGAVTAALSGFADAETITFTLDAGTTPLTTVPATVVTAAGGTASASVSIPSTTAGNHTLKATGSKGTVATATLTVGDPTGGAVDTTAPTLTTLARTTGATQLTRAATVSWTATFSEAVTGVDISDFALVGATSGASITSVTNNSAASSGAVWTVTAASGADGSLGLNLNDNDSIKDNAQLLLGGPGTGTAGAAGVGNGSLVGETYTVDKTGPTVTVNQKTGTADPTNAVPMTWTVTWNQAVTGFDDSDLVRAGTSGGTVTLTGSGAAYEIALTGTPTNGATTFAIASGAVTDAAGNGSSASTSTDNSITYDTVGPSAADIQTTIAGTAGRVDVGDVITYTFSENVAPGSIVAGWTGSSLLVDVEFTNNTSARGFDRLSTVRVRGNQANVSNNAVLTPLGTVDLGSAGYFSSAATGQSAARATASLVDNVLTLTISTAPANTAQVTGSTELIWAPAAGATDALGNAMSTGTRTESGTADRDF